MKTLFAVIGLALASSSPAFSDGFVCSSAEENLVVKIYNKTDPEAGTRTGAIMVLSDSSVGVGNKTIAKFTDSEGNLGSRSSVYSANVDLRFNNSGRKGELIAGTKLGELKNIIVDLDFSYTRPLEAGEYVRGDMTLIKRDGDKILVYLDCARYLKN